MYKLMVKPFFDRLFAFVFVALLWWLYIVIAILVRIKLGSPVLFVQERPGKIDPKTGKEKIFKLYKFRTMTDEKDDNGNILPDEERLTGFGKLLRTTSLDEIPEILFNVLIFHNLSFVGPRPLLIKYLPYYTERERERHKVIPGLTGYAQTHGRNMISWEKKFELDCWYVEHISFYTDLRIILDTIKTVISSNNISLNALEDFDEYRKRVDDSNN